MYILIVHYTFLLKLYFDSKNIIKRKLIALLASKRLHSELSYNGSKKYSLSLS